MSAPKLITGSLVKLSLIAIAVFLVSAVAVVLALAGVRSSSTEAINAWRGFADQASAEQRTLRNYVTMAGLGGFIDDYGQLVATGDEALAGMLYARGGAAMASIAAYPALDKNEAEQRAQVALQQHLRAHIAKIAPIMAMHRAGRPVAEIANFAQVDSADATAALDTLVDAVLTNLSADTATLPKALVLLEVRALLGVEGVIQNANDWLATGDNSSRAEAEAAIARTHKALARYRQHVLSQNELMALGKLEAEFTKLESGLDSAASKYLDTKEVQSSLLALEMVVFEEATKAQNNLQDTLNKISSQAGFIIILVVVGAILLLAGSIWLLVFRIGRRVDALTLTMRDLAHGKLDVEIPSAEDSDEIGEMSRALLVFRDGLRANAAMTQELAESSRLASLGAMVAGMAHELNTPLGNALSVSSTLEEQCKAFRKDLNSERILRSVLDRHAASLEDAAVLIQRNLLRASDQIGSFKQVAVDQTSGQRREFSLDDVLANVVQTIGPMFKRTPFTVQRGDASGVMMDSYPGALSQVVTNLIENGLKHGLAGQSSGSVEVSVRCLGPQFTEVIVSDNGVGIPDEVKPSIFRAFFTTKAGKGGSGLGLHIVKSIVCGPLGGQISVISESGMGSRFIVTLPNKAPAAQPADMKDMERVYYAAAQAA